ncbi:RNA polymerase sigma factor [Actinokineospora diospyrosa]|uniref:RNA polymerase sigma-70 factor, ECF subfamily n=1 Tax=Actinokineospora diospyrosa TaxID=103728 RepID=A0ABT1IGR0_9PSEU|nr:sigma-70 family RNA polymerase sigma factor [Actinokineospora diospyrosa]MCP2271828.1 RNA polymerase sigma-70 factor, ECF subfamily [Actinokineospora diospyrosa]
MIDSPHNDDLADAGPVTLEVLYERHNRKLTHYVARRMSYDQEATIQVVENTWEVVCVRFDEERHPRDWNAYLWRVAQNKVADWFRNSSRSPTLLHLSPDDLGKAADDRTAQADVAETAERRALRAALLLAIRDSLTPPQRQAIILRYIDELTLSEISSIMGVSRTGVKKHIQRGIANARKALAKVGYIVTKEAR